MLWPARPSFALSLALTFRPHHTAAASLEHKRKPLQRYNPLQDLRTNLE
jgi:hypothetical protein